MPRLLFLLFLFFFCPPLWASSKPYDHSEWDQFLKKYVDDSGAVNYSMAKNNSLILASYLEQISKIDREDFETWPREEAMALWINVYNASIIQEILRHYPLKTVHEIPEFWDTTFINVAGRKYNLHDIRLRILIGVYRDVKIHTALACGAKSCPRLSRDAYTGPHLDGQLYLAATRFVNDPVLNQITPSEKKVRLSRVFQWYARDFMLNFGSAEPLQENFKTLDYAVLSFVNYYLEDPGKADFLEQSRFKIKYLKFDWALNDAAVLDGAKKNG